MVPFVIHILEPLMTKSEPSFRAVVRSASTSVPTLGSDMHMPPMSSPVQAFGRYAFFWASLPLTWRLFTNSIECARYERQNAGSAAESSSWAMTAPTASSPAPPYSGATVTPRMPSSEPRRRSSGRLSSSFRLNSRACGRTWSSTKRRIVSRRALCSSVGL
eukprot:Amastigsp_a342332_40.p3 type:complete len:161 gc:universal Amastigsp_a342332_40:616-134(-)